jgi:hypothetical protein
MKNVKLILKNSFIKSKEEINLRTNMPPDGIKFQMSNITSIILKVI